MSPQPPYRVVADNREEPVELWPRSPDAYGVIMAVNRAAALSRKGGPHEVHRPDGTLLARFVLGERADLPALQQRRGVGSWDRTRQAE